MVRRPWIRRADPAVTLTVADIEAWDADDVREVARAARNRADAVFGAAAGLSGLPVFGRWEGQAAQVARESIERTCRDLRSQGDQALAVAEAARRAADSIEGIQSDLAGLRADAAALGMEIDPSANRIVAAPGRRPFAGDVIELQSRLDSVVEQANSVDAALAAAIHLAGGSFALAPSQGPDPDVRDALAGRLPEDPKAFHDLWQKLSMTERDLLYSRDHAIGNHPGMPTGDAWHPGSDHYNRLHLAGELEAALASNAEHLPDLEAVAASLDGARDDGADARLMLLDLTSGARVHAAIAIGDPDSATHVSVTTPGLNTTVRGDMTTMTAHAVGLQREAKRQLRAAGKTGDTAAAIAWIGYDAPQIPGPGDVPLIAGLPLSVNPLDVIRSELGAYEVSHDDVAKAAAVNLAGFYDGIQAARDVGPAHLTAIGHSYGSLTTGLALQVPGDHGVSDAIFYGSPGIEASTPAQLNLAPGHVFAMETPDDPIDYAYQAPPLLRAVAAATPFPFDDVLVGALDLSDTGEFGPNPATNPNFVRLETGPSVVVDGGVVLQFDEASGHSDYPRLGTTVGPDGELLPRTPGYNIAAVVGGLSERAIRGD